MTAAPLVSVIVPVLDDEQALAALLGGLDDPTVPDGAVEVVVVDGGSERTGPLAALERRHPTVRWLYTGPGRGHQMNAGAARACGRWLVFVHADTRLERGWIDEFRRLDAQAEVAGGAFRFTLDSPDWRARVVEWGVGRRVAWFALPYGDQALFVRRDVFAALGGYTELPLMEDVDFIRRLAVSGRLVWLERRAITSARRWRRDGWVRRSTGNVLLLLRYFAGTPPARLADLYWGPPGRRRVGASVDAEMADRSSTEPSRASYN